MSRVYTGSQMQLRDPFGREAGGASRSRHAGRVGPLGMCADMEKPPHRGGGL